MPISEAYSWVEGSVWLWTGNAVLPATSAQPLYCENISVTPTVGYDNRAAAGGLYRDHVTGQIANLIIGALYTKDLTVWKLFESRTAVHVKLLHSSVNGSAGIYLYSGRIGSLPIAGSDGQIYKQTVNYYANAWSGF